jgi:hypothetical protein
MLFIQENISNPLFRHLVLNPVPRYGKSIISSLNYDDPSMLAQLSKKPLAYSSIQTSRVTHGSYAGKDSSASNAPLILHMHVMQQS